MRNTSLEPIFYPAELFVHLLNYFKYDTFILLNYYKFIKNYYRQEKTQGGAILRRQALPVILSFLLAAFILTGCGSDAADELSTYQASMETFCDNISYLNDEINSLDGTGDTDVETLLEHLDTLDEQFAQMAQLTVPDKFATIDHLADEASENMNMAVTYYHQAYDSGTYNPNYGDAAYEYYTRANVRLGYILQILHGEEILDDNVRYISGDEGSEEPSDSRSEESSDEQPPEPSDEQPE